MATDRTDLLVVGGGPAGTAAARRTAELGAAMTLVESTHLGGTCVNTGCVPAGVLACSRGAHDRATGRRGATHTSEPQVDIHR